MGGGVWPLRAREVRPTERGSASSGRPAESKEILDPPCSRSLRTSSLPDATPSSLTLPREGANTWEEHSTQRPGCWFSAFETQLLTCDSHPPC